jgi:alkylation response protein AidB-like acyl-CoA dehydrogenase
MIDMKTPGLEVRPIYTIDGHRQTNEVFFTDVRVPAANLIGEENRGWDYAKFLLGNERNGIARVGLTKSRLREAKRLALKQRMRNGTLWDDPTFRNQFARTELQLKGLEITAMRMLDAERHGEKGKPNPMSSILKLKGADIQKDAAELMMKAAGPHAMPVKWEGNGSPESVEALNEWAEGKTATYLISRAASIYGGSNEIQRNILSKAVLGL